MHSTQITFRNLRHSRALGDRIRALCDQLERHHPGMITCRVGVEQAAAHRRDGNLYEATVRVRVPGREFVASHGHDRNLHLALREAFDAVRRQMGDRSDLPRAAVRRRIDDKAKAAP